MSLNDALEQIENVRCAVLSCAVLRCAALHCAELHQAVRCCAACAVLRRPAHAPWCCDLAAACLLAFSLPNLRWPPELAHCSTHAWHCRWATTFSCSRTRPMATSRCSTAAGQWALGPWHVCGPQPLALGQRSSLELVRVR